MDMYHVAKHLVRSSRDEIRKEHPLVKGILLLKAAGFTQSTISDWIGLSQPYISQLLKGKVSPSVKSADKLVTILVDVLSGENEVFHLAQTNTLKNYDVVESYLDHFFEDLERVAKQLDHMLAEAHNQNQNK